MSNKYVIAYDLGTTGNKATMFDKEGNLINWHRKFDEWEFAPIISESICIPYKELEPEGLEPGMETWKKRSGIFAIDLFQNKNNPDTPIIVNSGGVFSSMDETPHSFFAQLKMSDH